MKRIFLIGYMGSGKTTIGRFLAARLKFSFVDMDTFIEEKYFKSISQIFAEYGEEKFRRIEQECLHDVAQFENTIISTGGGAPCFFDNMEFMNNHGTTIYLKLSPAELAERLENSHTNKRPLLENKKGDELLQLIARGLSVREPFYLQAAHSVAGEIENVVTEILKLTQNSTDHKK